MGKNRLFIYLFILMSLVTQGYSAEEKKEEGIPTSFKTNKIDQSSSDVKIDIQIQNSKEKNIEFTARFKEENAIKINAQKLPVNLWVLLDSSAPCKSYGFNKYSKDLIKSLQETLHPDSLVSILSYRKKKQYHFYNHSKVKDLKLLNFECEPDSQSASYQEALIKMLETKEKVSLPTYVWVFSAGNGWLSGTIADQIKKRNINIQFILYRPKGSFILNKLKKQSLEKLGSDLFSAQNATADELKGTIPSLFYELEFSMPRAKRGINQSIQIEAKAGEKKLTETFVSVLVEKGPFHQVITVLLYLAYGLGVILFFYLLYKTIRFYMPKKCSNCGEFMRRSDDFCMMCEKDIKGYIVIKSQINKKELDRVIPIGKKKISVGSSSSCKIKLESPKDGQSLQYFTLKTEILRLAGRTVLIKSNTFLENLNLKVNGTFLHGEKYISSGDRIEVPGYHIYFYMEKEE